MKQLVECPPADARVFFVDQSDVGLYPKVGPDWGPRGEQMKVYTRGKNQKTYLFGALDAHTEDLIVGFWPRKNSVAFVDFLRQLLASVPEGEIHLVLDNYGVHKSKRTCQFLAREAAQRLHFHSLPTYSPWLNPIEISWRVIKRRAGTNKWRDSIESVHHDFAATLAGMGATLTAPSTHYVYLQGMT